MAEFEDYFAIRVLAFSLTGACRRWEPASGMERLPLAGANGRL